ncbi:MAG: DnaA N-terminal domain-containing protein [Solirubrobacteraceae bacterium]
MSRDAIAAVLARDDLACGDRLAAFSLASFAGREHRAWPGAAAAAQRAGLSRSRYLQARDRLVRRGLVLVETEASGRGRSSTLVLALARTGPWWEGEINVDLFEAVLGYSAATGVARLLLAAMAVLADEDGAVRDLTTERICAAAGIAAKSYQRAKSELLASGALVLVNGVGGRGNTNVWTVRDPCVRAGGGVPRAPRRAVLPAGTRPLVGVAGLGAASGAAAAGCATERVKGGQAQTVLAANGLTLTSLPAAKGGQVQTLFNPLRAETPAESPAQRAPERVVKTRPLRARGGTNAVNPGIPEDPPSPPAGGSRSRSMLVEQAVVSERGRRRRRMVRVDLDELRRGLGLVSAADRADWQRVRELLEATVGESTFSIWLDPVELVAVDGERRLVVAAPAAAAAWTAERYGRLCELRPAGRARAAVRLRAGGLCPRRCRAPS